MDQDIGTNFISQALEFAFPKPNANHYVHRCFEVAEMEANRLMVELPVPRALIRTFWRSGIQSLADLRRMFQEAALRFRLR